MHVPALAALAAITLCAAVVNGALGYGFSSITVPVALLFFANRVLNPAMVLVEILVNGYNLAINRQALPRVSRRVWPILLGLAPGVALGSCLLLKAGAGPIKLATYAVLLPIILAQAAGFRRPMRAERAAGGVFGVGLGALYSVTTISGPPLAILLNNQGYAKEEFRAALSLIRLVGSVMTTAAYAWAGLFAADNIRLAAWILPTVVVGAPAGAALIGRVDPETFRRVCMSFDSWIVGFGLSKAVLGLQPAAGSIAYLFFITAVAADAVLLAAYFSGRRSRPKVGAEAALGETP